MTARENSNCFAILIDSLDVENRIKLGLIVNGFKNSVEKWSVFRSRRVWLVRSR